jgi:hypothetical protein
MKKLIRYLAYLPVILLGIGGTVIVVDMWNITKTGRKKSALVKGKNKPAPSEQTLQKSSPGL